MHPLTVRTDATAKVALVKHLRTFTVLCWILAAGVPAAAAEITGAGSTFVYPVLSAWAEAYQKTGGAGLNYQAAGSGSGIDRIVNGTATFGASDMPLASADITANRLVQFPIVSGAVVPILNLPGRRPGEITLDGATIARIFLGEIATWDDPAIVKLNPGVTLPRVAITTVHRADRSGSTFIWTDYLSKVSPEWMNRIGADIVVNWPGGVGAKGSEGVLNVVTRVPGAFGYVEYTYAMRQNLTYAALINLAGKTVEPTVATFAAAAAGTDWTAQPDFRVIMTNAGGDQSWPVAGSTFILMQSAPADASRSLAALEFFHWTLMNGQEIASDFGYVPMPVSFVPLVEKLWAQRIKGADGKPVFSNAGGR